MARIAMVTGASSGIGEAYAEHLARDGWELVVVARRRERLEQLAARLTAAHGVAVQVIGADLSNVGAVQKLAADAAGMDLELLVNNAALAHYGPFVDLPADAAHELVQLDVLAPVLLTRSVLPAMAKRGVGAVVNIASLLAFSGGWEGPQLPQRAVYAASKSFLVTFTQVLAGELRDTGVRVQVVCPGIVRSEFHSRQGMDLSAVPRMEPGAVVQASLHDLERGVVVCVPGADDESAIERILDAQQGLQGTTRVAELPERYPRAH